MRTKKGHDAVRLSVVLNQTDLIQKLFDFENEKEEIEEIVGMIEEDEEISGPLNERKYDEIRKKKIEQRQKIIEEFKEEKQKEKQHEIDHKSNDEDDPSYKSHERDPDKRKSKGH
ncbi:hypothetical protein RFI_19536, partial [Reticulomyxa filosa]